MERNWARRYAVLYNMPSALPKRIGEIMTTTKSIKAMAVMLAGAVALLGALCLSTPTQAHADSIKANTWRTVTVGKNSYQTLTYTMPATGYVKVNVKALSSYSNWSSGAKANYRMNAEVKVKKGTKKLCEFFDQAVGTTKKSFAISYKKGTKITINIKNTFTSTDVLQVKVALTKKKYMESENNNSKTTADAISCGKAKTLTAVSSSGDWDWYKFTAPAKATYKIQMRCTETSYKKSMVAYDNYVQLIYPKKAWKTVEKVELEKGAVKTFKAGAGSCDGMVYQIRIVKA